MNTTSLIQKILIVENDTQEQERIGLLLDALGIDFQAATTAPEALRVLREESFDLVLSRPGMADDHALPVLAQIAHVVPMTPIVALKRAGESTELWGGVTPWEILDCPVLPEQLQSALMRASGALSTQQRIAMLEDQLAQAMTPPPIVGSSKEMIQLLEKMEDAAFSHQPTILIGETGSHKESLARALHDLSAQRAGAFVALTCQAEKPEPADSTRPPGEAEADFLSSLLQSSRSAAGGTLFIAHIERLRLAKQSQLFEFLESRDNPSAEHPSEAPPARIVVSSNTALGEEVESGSFLKELRDRFDLNRLLVPPLRERRQDIALLADHWCRVFGQTHNRALWGVSDEAMTHLLSHSWPGNLRELEAVIRLAVSRCEDDRITPTDLPLDLFDSSDHNETESSKVKKFDLKASRQRAEAQIIRRALKATDGNRTHAAKLLNISHRALLYKLKAYEI